MHTTIYKVVSDMNNICMYCEQEEKVCTCFADLENVEDYIYMEGE